MTTRGVRNPMKMSDVGFLKSEPNRPQNSKTENSVSAVRFSKTDFSCLGTVFQSVLPEILVILFTQSTAVLHKYLNDELKYFVCYNFSLRLHRIP